MVCSISPDTVGTPSSDVTQPNERVTPPVIEYRYGDDINKNNKPTIIATIHLSLLEYGLL